MQYFPNWRTIDIIQNYPGGRCSISQTGEQLILFRIIQAVGAAVLFSNSAAIITDTFPENERAKALGLNQTAIVVGSVVGRGWRISCYLLRLEIHFLD